MRKPLLIIGSTLLVLLLVVALAVAGLRWWEQTTRTELQRAIDAAPADAQRFSWTDWAAVRAELGYRPGSPTTAEIEEFLSAGYDADLTSSSALVDSAAELQRKFGFSPATVEWELLAQGTNGSVALVKVDEATSFDTIGKTLEQLGYTRPGSRRDVWVGGTDLLAGIGGITPQLQYVALDEEERLLRLSDSGEYLDAVVKGEDGTLRAAGRASTAAPGPRGDADDEGLSAVAEAAGEPLVAAVYTGTQACSSLAMGQADATDQEQADRLIDQAGEVDPLTGFAMTVQPGGDVRVALAFETEDQARDNTDTRAALARGPAPGQGGDFPDRFTVDSVSAEGRVITLALTPVEGAYVLSDLSTGPLLFATC